VTGSSCFGHSTHPKEQAAKPAHGIELMQKCRYLVEMNGMRRARVLVVDDEASIRMFAETVLSDAGFEVITAPDGPEALRLVDQEAPFNLFVLDVMMPQMQGAELGRQLRQREPDARILYMTGCVDALFEARNDTLWARETFVEKPVSAAGLREAVSLLLAGVGADGD